MPKIRFFQLSAGNMHKAVWAIISLAVLNINCTSPGTGQNIATAAPATFVKQVSVVQNSTPENYTDSLEAYHQQAYAFCKTKRYNTSHYVLIDVGRHSGLPRFFVYDFSTAQIQHSFLVSHGCYTGRWMYDDSKENAFTSNTPDTHASSVGKYKIGERGSSSFGIGIKYLLHGLDSTNSNALARAIVLHSWSAIPNANPYPNGTPEGWGCPAIADSAMRIADTILQSAEKPVLLWVIKL